MESLIQQGIDNFDLSDLISGFIILFLLICLFVQSNVKFRFTKPKRYY